MKLFYREFGEGDPIILLHGLFGSSDNWVSFSRKLSSDINKKIIIPDLRNHGQSPHHPNFRLEALVDDLKELISDLKLEKPIVVGHSLGGKILLKTLEENPTLFSKIIIVDMGLREYEPKYGHIEILELIQNNDLSEFKHRYEVENYVSKSIIDKRIQSFILKNVHWKSRDILGWKINIQAISDHFSEIFFGIKIPNPIHTKTLFIKGSHSDYINNEDVRLISQNFTNATMVEIDDSGHWVHVDNPDVFYQVVKEYIKKIT